MNYIGSSDVNNTVVEIVYGEQVESAELDEMWRFVQNKGNQRWLWLAIDHETRMILAYAFGKRKDAVFRPCQTLLETLA